MVAIKKFDFTAGIKPENTEELLEDCKNFIGNLKICALGVDAEQGYELIQRIKLTQSIKPRTVMSYPSMPDINTERLRCRIANLHDTLKYCQNLFSEIDTVECQPAHYAWLTISSIQRRGLDRIMKALAEDVRYE